MDRTNTAAKQLTIADNEGVLRTSVQGVDLALALEAALFASGEAIRISETAKTLGISTVTLEETLRELQREYDRENRGICLRLFGDSAQMTTRALYSGVVRTLLNPIQKVSLTQAVLETLAIVAYRQPVTRPEIDQMRGVKSDATVHTLVNRGLIRELGRRESLGRPMEFGTTDLFLKHFGLNSINELPSEQLENNEHVEQLSTWMEHV